MTVKALAHTAQTRIETTTGSPFKRSHVYELVAAALGFSSLAALYADHVLCVGAATSGANRLEPHAARAIARASSLGCSAVVARCAALNVVGLIHEHGLHAKNLDWLLAQTRWKLGLGDAPQADESNEPAPENDTEDYEDEDEWELPPEEDDSSPDLREALNRAAAAGDGRAHYILSLLLQKRDEDSPEEGSAHWYRMQQSGMKLDGVEKEWADNYAAAKADLDLATRHLESAAELGNAHALLDLAEQRDDASYFHRAAESGGAPNRLADLASRFDEPNVQYWLTAAAERGDVASIRILIEQFDHDDLKRCWTWVYFAQMLGSDLTKSDLHAYHDGGMYDGQLYEDDQGGPLYVSGTEGVELEPLPPADEASARENAAHLFTALRTSSSSKSGC